ncbi:potassium channel family protein [Nocardiopsis sp. L17-MgMaSL7]|uniref:potassium channel family protein n=1 Tax=Nocardiopsis sp. L17-MgMaSL7 TaxID=1938893 RepID=UPI000D7130FE|nr:potassium channel family protein [Nocardiopsis sp. L17-MgMaSL7]PWV54938.1 ion channel [Nocardiopsis sp. L17-MgMaSL7]
MRGRPGLSHPLAAFLAASALLHFAYPLTLRGQLWEMLYVLLYPAVVFLGVRVVRDEGHRLVPVAVLSVVFLAAGFWAALHPAVPTARLGLFCAVVLFQGYLILKLLVFVFTYRRRHRGETGPQLIMAAVCAYLLLGGVFAALFGIVEALWPGSFEDSLSSGTAVDWQDLTYLSFVTLVTLGYGDLVPVTPWARSLATAEAVAGTLFLTTVIARIVGAYVTVTQAGGPGTEPGTGRP